MKKSSAWLIYTLLRLAAFIVPLAILLAFQVNYLVAGILAAIIGLCVSYIFFAKWRGEISTQMYESRQHKAVPVNVDEDAEDAEIEAASRQSPPSRSASTAGPQKTPTK